MHAILTIVVLFLLAPVLATPTKRQLDPVKRKKIVLETDLLSFVDDVAAVSLANYFHNTRDAELLGVVSNVRSKYSATAISSINKFYQNDDIPIAQTKPTDDSTSEPDHGPGHSFIEGLIKMFPHNNPNPLTPVKFYHDVLKANDNVTILSVGFLKNLADLYRSPGGRDLIARKVDRLVVQGGHFDEDNKVAYYMAVDLDSALVLQNWPSPVTYIGGRLPHTVKVDVHLNTSTSSPIATALELYNARGSKVTSGDYLAVWYGVFGLGQDFKYGGEPGRLLIDRNDVYDPASTATILPGNTPEDRLQNYLALAPGASATDLAKRMDDILRKIPHPN